MACPTCDHTLEGVGNGVFHCPRCGTMVTRGLGELVATVPKLVTRCREFGRTMSADEDAMLLTLWVGLGIDESIYLPAERAKGG